MSTPNWNQNPNEPNEQTPWGSSWDAVGRPNPPQPGQPSQGVPGQQGPLQPDAAQPRPNGSASEPTVPGYQPGAPASQPTAPPPAKQGWEGPGWTNPPQNQWQTSWHNSTQHPGDPRYAEQQPDQGWQQPGGQGQPGSQWTQPPGTAPASTRAPRPKRDNPVSPFLRALFDLDFRRYVTPRIVRILYVLSIVAVALYWIGTVIVLFASARSTSAFTGQTTTNGGVMFLAVLDLLVGWIFALAVIALIRMQYEFMLALIRTSEYARDIKAHLGAPDAGEDTPRPEAAPDAS